MREPGGKRGREGRLTHPHPLPLTRFSECKADELEWLPINEGKTWLTLMLVSVTMIIMTVLPK